MKLLKIAFVITAAVSLSACGLDLSNNCQLICF